MFQRCLQRLHQTLHKTGIVAEWHAPPNSHPERMTSTSSFYHVWNALEFLSCTSRNEVTIREQFGDGIQLAGCTVVHLLGQRSLYELWNVNHHVLSVHHQEQTRARVAAAATSKTSRAASGLANGDITQSVGSLGREMQDTAAAFAANATAQSWSSDKIFHVLEIAWPQPPPASSTEPRSGIDGPRAPLRPPAFVPPQSDARTDSHHKATTAP